MNVAMSVLMYGAPIWADSTKVAYRRAEIEKVQRKAALRCVHAYRIVLTEAVCVLACSLPINLLAEVEAKKKAKKNTDVLRVKREAGNSLLEKWKE